MNSARDRKIRAKNRVEQLIKDVFIQRPITNLVETSYGFRACFGLKKDGTPDKRRLGWKDRALAKEIKEQMKLAYDQGQSYAQIGKTFGLSRMSVWRRLKGHIEAKKTLTT